MNATKERRIISLTVFKLIFILTAAICAFWIAAKLSPPSGITPAVAQQTTERASIYAIGNYPKLDAEPHSEAVRATTAAETTGESLAVEAINIEPIVRQYNGIYEGDTIIGEGTFFCACKKCNGREDGKTASGFIIQQGIQSYTISCNWLPFGAVIEIDGVQYTIRDRGGKGLNIVGNVDIFEPDGHKAAYDKGRLKNIEITIVYLPEDTP